jgi:hypothetical protein
MMREPVRRITRERLQSCDEALVPTAWVGGECENPDLSDMTWLSSSKASLSRVTQGTPVLVMLGTKGTPAWGELLAHASAGARVYVLLDSSWNLDQSDAELLQASEIFLRRIPEIPVSAVHASSQARIWIGADLHLRLDDAQALALRQTFLRLFWHEATEEAWSGGKSLVWRVAGERPFDVPEIARTAAIRRDTPDARLESDARGGILHLSAGGPLPEVVPRRLWYPAGPEHHEPLARLAHAGTEVVWQALGLPDLLIGRGTGEVLLPGKRGRLRVRLTAAQSAEFERLLERQAHWRFMTNVRPAEPALREATFWLPGESGARGVEAEQLIELPDVTASSLQAVSETEPTSVPSPQPLALSARYRWTVVPPRVPTGTAEDTLVGQWRKLDEEWNIRLTNVRRALDASEGERSRIARAFSRLASALLGFERTHSGLLKQVVEMESQTPSVAGPAGAFSMVARLGEIDEQTRKFQADLEASERKAREDEEREKQEAAWRERRDAAQREMPKRRAELAEAEKRTEALQEELASIDNELKGANKEVRKDLDARRRKRSDDLARTKKEVSRLRNEANSLERQADEPFEFLPPSVPSVRPPTPGVRFMPPASNSRSTSKVPDESLPEVGTLRSLKDKRYLVIQNWNELAVGDQAAFRLSAKLVAPENA